MDEERLKEKAAGEAYDGLAREGAVLVERFAEGELARRAALVCCRRPSTISQVGKRLG